MAHLTSGTKRLAFVLLTVTLSTALLRAQTSGEAEIAPPSSALQGDLNLLLGHLPNARIALDLKQPQQEGAGEPQHILITADDVISAGVYNLKSKVPVLFLGGKIPELPINLQIAAVAYALAEMLIQQNPQLKQSTSDYQDLDRVALAVWAGHGMDLAALLESKRRLEMQTPASKPQQPQKFNPEVSQAFAAIFQAGEPGVVQAYNSGDNEALNAIARRHPDLKHEVDVLEAYPKNGSPAPFQTQPTNIKTVPRMQAGQNMPTGGSPADLMSDMETRVATLNAGGASH